MGNHTRLAAVVVAALALAACGSDSADDAASTEAPVVSDSPSGTDVSTDDGAQVDGTVTVYSGRGEDLVGPLLTMFEEETGIDTEVRYGDSAEMLLLIQEEGENSPADVYYSQGAGFLGELSATGGLAEVPAELLDQVPEGLRSPADDWLGLSARARTVVYNTNELTEAELPATILGYTDPEWSGRIGYAPTNASFQDFVTALRSIEGEDAARAWLEGIIANGAVPYENNTAVVEAVAAGEVDVGFVNHYYLYRFLAEDPDFPVANHFGAEGDPGGLVNIAGAGILETSDAPEGAQALLEFLLSPAAQEYFATETFEIPVVEGSPAPEGIPALGSLSLPAFDLNQLLDLQGTVALLTEVGAL